MKHVSAGGRPASPKACSVSWRVGSRAVFCRSRPAIRALGAGTQTPGRGWGSRRGPGFPVEREGVRSGSRVVPRRAGRGSGQRIAPELGSSARHLGRTFPDTDTQDSARSLRTFQTPCLSRERGGMEQAEGQSRNHPHRPLPLPRFCSQPVTCPSPVASGAGVRPQQRALRPGRSWRSSGSVCHKNIPEAGAL